MAYERCKCGHKKSKHQYGMGLSKDQTHDPCSYSGCKCMQYELGDVAGDHIRVGSSTNALNKAILSLALFKGCRSWRQNTVGVWDEKRKCFRSLDKHSRGIGDIVIIVPPFGLHLEVDTKGKDKPTDSQLAHKKEIEEKGGIFWFVKSTYEFEQKINTLIANIGTLKSVIPPNYIIDTNSSNQIIPVKKIGRDIAREFNRKVTG
jgi:hypothetical protein